MNNVTFVIGASSGNADNLAKLVRRMFSDAIDLASKPSDVYEPRAQVGFSNCVVSDVENALTASDAAVQRASWFGRWLRY